MNIQRLCFTFLLTVLGLVTPVLSANEHASGPFKHYSRQSESVVSQATTVETPSPMSKRTQSELVGSWKCVAAPSNAVPGVQLRSLVFEEHGTVEYDFEESAGGNVQKKTETYSVFHKGAVDRFPGKAPTIIIGGDDPRDDQVIPLVNVSVDYDSRFPMSAGKRLRFTDLDGNEYIFMRDMSRAPFAASEQESEAADVTPGSSGAVKPTAQERRVVNPSLTREICANLQTGKLTESERNKEIVRLMNEGDGTCVPVLLAHLKAEHSLVVRQNAIRALGKVGDKRAVSPLLDILRAPVQGKVEDEADDEAILRRNAVVALGDIGDSAALPVLRTVSESAREYQSVRDLARITAKKLEGM